MTLQDIIDRATANGHDMLELPADSPMQVAPGVFAFCGTCYAHLRFYKQRAGGEAYLARCPRIPGTLTFMQPKPAAAPPNQMWSNDELAAMQQEERRELYATSSLNAWSRELMRYAKEKGWATTPEDENVGTLVALMHSELSELLEEWRSGHEPTHTYYADPGSKRVDKPEGVPSELADLIIRALHFAGIFGIDIDAAVIEKHEYNLTRPYRHGGKRV